ncbi:MAG TPA: hypothetical protein VL393_01740 [Candidatus Binataceae bacterium]|jgi:hypothetical protein|nr:hypothetical protein [Candidatus Binataceae bacterium]
MPRRKGSASSSFAIRQFRRQAGSVLAKLRKDIRAKEMELVGLKREEAALSQIAGRAIAGSAAVARAPRAAGGGGGGGRINWRNVLGQLPKQFKASNVRQVRGLKDKRPSEIFAAITRWIEAGLVKRKTRGLYEKA